MILEGIKNAARSGHPVVSRLLAMSPNGTLRPSTPYQNHPDRASSAFAEGIIIHFHFVLVIYFHNKNMSPEKDVMVYRIRELQYIKRN